MKPAFVDSHAHLDFPEYEKDLDAVLERAAEAGVGHVVTVGTGVDSSRKCALIASTRKSVAFTVGIHPHEASSCDAKALSDLRAIAASGAVAVGEIGLDFFRNRSPVEDQYRAFRSQLSMATDLGLPVIVHSREAWPETFAVLKEMAPPKGGVVHCFSGGPEEAGQAFELGMYLSFACPLTYKNSEKARLAAAAVPLDHLLLETDSPFMPPQDRRGKRNEPSAVVEIARVQASLHGCSLADAARITSYAARKLFGVGPEIPSGLVAYPIRDSLYLNITNRCTLNCGFCGRQGDYGVAGYSLKLPAEPTADEIMSAIALRGAENFREVVFCGYGEPTVRLAELVEVGKRLRAAGSRVRLNTNGTANAFHGRDVTPELAQAVDDVSISLNAQDAATYESICRPTFRGAYEAMLDFTRLCRGRFASVTATVVDGVEGVDADAVERIAGELGVGFRRRVYQFTG